MSGAPDGVVEVVDARGLLCPLPVVHLARAAAAAPPGSLLQVLTTDPAALSDVPAWARMRGHALVARTDEPDGSARLTVRTTDPDAPS
ncbi:sulfurtransferase TusA family protein [Cellulomonas marina]|uniref:sulfurtransferase TusA family protein n=1 Tax=Cellulomonas marina TaxID=988821 RepID=UPI000B7D7B53|nr:sulfurtransferase TusA family protein [Cellulomonas marina]